MDKFNIKEYDLEQTLNKEVPIRLIIVQFSWANEDDVFRNSKGFYEAKWDNDRVNFLQSILDFAATNNANIIVFPEITFPSSFHSKIEDFCNKNKDVIVVAGSTYGYRNNKLLSIAKIFVNNKSYEYQKFKLSDVEINKADFTNSPQDGGSPAILKNTLIGNIGLLVCSDFLHYDLRNYYLSNYNFELLIIIAFNRRSSFEYFGKFDEVFKDDGPKYPIVFSNNYMNGYGDGKSSFFSFLEHPIRQRLLDNSIIENQSLHNQVAEFVDENGFIFIEHYFNQEKLGQQKQTVSTRKESTPLFYLWQNNAIKKINNNELINYRETKINYYFNEYLLSSLSPESFFRTKNRAKIHNGFFNDYYWLPNDTLTPSLKKIISTIKHSTNSFLVLGNPLQGKTRAVFWVLKKLFHENQIKNKFIYIPKSNWFETKYYPLNNLEHSIFFFDDLDSYLSDVNKSKSFVNLYYLLKDKNIPIIATCRSGKEYEIIKELFEKINSNILEEFITIKLGKFPSTELNSFKTSTLNYVSSDSSIPLKVKELVISRINAKHNINHFIGQYFVPDLVYRERYKSAIKQSEIVNAICYSIYLMYEAELHKNLLFDVKYIKIISEAYLSKPVTLYDFNAGVAILEDFNLLAKVDTEISIEEIIVDSIFDKSSNIILFNSVVNITGLNHCLVLNNLLLKSTVNEVNDFNSHILKFGDQFTFSILLNKAGTYENAIKIYESYSNILPKNTIVYNSIIKYCSSFKLSVEWYETMLSSGYIPDSYTFSILISKCSQVKIEDLSSFILMLSTQEESFTIDIYLATQLLEYCSLLLNQFAFYKHLKDIFKYLKDSNIIYTNSIILLKYNSLKTTFEVNYKIKSLSTKNDAIKHLTKVFNDPKYCNNLNEIWSFCDSIKSEGVILDSLFLANVLAKINRFKTVKFDTKQILVLIEKLEHYNNSALQDIRLWNAILQIIDNKKSLEEIYNIKNQYCRDIDIAFLNNILDNKLGIDECLDFIKSYNKYDLKPNIHTASILINKADTFSNSLLLLSNFKLEEFDINKLHNIINVMLKKSNSFESTLENYRILCSKYNFKPKIDTLNSLLSKAKNIQQVQQVISLFDFTIKDFDNYTISILIERTNDFESAESLLKDFLANNKKPNAYVFNTLIKKSGSLETTKTYVNAALKYLNNGSDLIAVINPYLQKFLSVYESISFLKENKVSLLSHRTFTILFSKVKYKAELDAVLKFAIDVDFTFNDINLDILSKIKLRIV